MKGQKGDPAADTECGQALTWLRGFTLDVDGSASDEARWDGENAILVYDWCHYALSAADRSMLIDRWNGYISALNNKKDWGHLNMAANNYFWGYLRNSLLWGIASFHDKGAEQQNIANGFIEHALKLRYATAFQKWYGNFGIGGVPLEGTQYGPYMLDYPVIAFTAATDYGYDAWSAVPFWRDTLFYLQYAAAPMRTRARDEGPLHFELFPFNDDERFVNGGSAEGAYNDFLATMILRDPTRPLAVQAWTWMNHRDEKPSWALRAELASITVSGAGPSLPLDYYAEGAKFLYGRRDSAPEATTFMLQLGGVDAYDDDNLEVNGGVGHSHQDLGNFQLWRKGRWLTRESTGYADMIRGWNNGAAVDTLNAVAHNTALFEGRGQIHARRGLPVVTRLQSRPDFAFAAVDMTESYRAPATETWLAKDDWPFAEKAIREFVYLRKLDALIILDRLTSGSDSLDPIYDNGYTGPQMAGSQVRKSFVLHATGKGADGTGNPFTLGAGQATAEVGGQRMDLMTLLPELPTYRVINEGGPIGQFRLEYDVSGTETSYLLNVVSGRDSTDVSVKASLVDLGDRWEVNLAHPTKGNVSVVLRKGTVSTGGAIKTEQGTTSLLDTKETVTINDNGIFWGGAAFSFLRAPLLPPR